MTLKITKSAGSLSGLTGHLIFWACGVLQVRVKKQLLLTCLRVLQVLRVHNMGGPPA